MVEGLFQPTHLIIILMIVFIVFGAGKLPEVGGALGKSIKEFKESSRDDLNPSIEQGTSASTTVTTSTSQRPLDLPGARLDEV